MTQINSSQYYDSQANYPEMKNNKSSTGYRTISKRPANGPMVIYSKCSICVVYSLCESFLIKMMQTSILQTT